MQKDRFEGRIMVWVTWWFGEGHMGNMRVSGATLMVVWVLAMRSSRGARGEGCLGDGLMQGGKRESSVEIKFGFGKRIGR